jgi:hypothetical protein
VATVPLASILALTAVPMPDDAVAALRGPA